MKYYSFLFFINIIFFLVWKFIDINLNIKLIFGLFDSVYILCIYVYRNQPDLYNKIINNCKKSENKPVILNSYNNIDPLQYNPNLYTYNNNQASSSIFIVVFESDKSHDLSSLIIKIRLIFIIYRR